MIYLRFYLIKNVKIKHLEFRKPKFSEIQNLQILLEMYFKMWDPNDWLNVRFYLIKNLKIKNLEFRKPKFSEFQNLKFY